jgi:glycosyltransferase involved in cell wall biosynthesis
MDHCSDVSDLSSKAISVIVPAHNAERSLGRAIASVRAQTQPVFETLVVDDGSTDRTVEILTALADDDSNSVRVLRQPQRGAAAARNAGIRAAHGDLIAFLDDDDWWEPEKTARQLSLMAEHQAPLSFTGGRRINGVTTQLLVLPDWPQAWQDAVHNLLMHDEISTSSVIVERQLLFKAGLFNEHLGLGEDYDLWLRIVLSGHRFDYVPLPLVNHSYGMDNITLDYAARGIRTDASIVAHTLSDQTVPRRFSDKRDWYVAHHYLDAACVHLQLRQGHQALVAILRAMSTCPRAIRLGWLRIFARALVMSRNDTPC